MRISIIALAIALSIPAIAFTNQLQNQGPGQSGRLGGKNVAEGSDKTEMDDDEDKDRKKEKSKSELERAKKKGDDKDKDDDDEDKDDDDEDKDDDDEDKDDDDENKDDDDEDKDDDDEDKDDDDEDKDDDDEDKDDDKGDENKSEGKNKGSDKKDTDENNGNENPNPSALLAVGPELNSSPTTISPVTAVGVMATIETAPVPSVGDAADDPAIWINPKDAAQSTIIGSNKQGGLAVYDLTGKQLQYLPDGLMNNVDLRGGFKLGGSEVTVVAAGNRADNSIALYRVNPATRMLENVAARKIITIATYGSCLYRSQKTGKFYYIVASKSGEVEQWELLDKGGKVDAKSVRRFTVGTQLEGCVADDELGHLYIGEEAVGIWKYGAEPDAGDGRVQVDKTGVGGHLVADVEGLTIAYGKDGTGYLIASSQGNNTFVIYKRESNNAHVKTFNIISSNGIDGVEDTDGIDVTMTNLGPGFPEGVFVAQDGINDKGNQNFKLVPFQSILKAK